MHPSSARRFMRLLPFVFAAPLLSAQPLRIATFRVDATPPLGSPLCGGAVAPAKEIVDPLSARGIVLFGTGKPVVLAAVDWLGIANEGWDQWRSALAKAAGTTPDRVTVHTLHQHDAPVFNPGVERRLAPLGLGGRMFDPAFAQAVLDHAAAALREAVRTPVPVTHIAFGSARVEQVASNRRVLGPDGKVRYVRYSACKIPEARAEPEGTIDPYVRVLGLWNGDRPLAVLTWYATHPQSYYGQGGVSADFVGMARATREKDLPGVFVMHFNGASGNVTAGKYNDGAPENRPVLAARLARGMRAAWESAVRRPVSAADLSWRIEPVRLPLAERLRDATPSAAPWPTQRPRRRHALPRPGA